MTDYMRPDEALKHYRQSIEEFKANKPIQYSLVEVKYNPDLFVDDNGHEFGRITWIDADNRTVHTFLPVEVLRELATPRPPQTESEDSR